MQHFGGHRVSVECLDTEMGRVADVDADGARAPENGEQGGEPDHHTHGIIP